MDTSNKPPGVRIREFLSGFFPGYVSVASGSVLGMGLGLTLDLSIAWKMGANSRTDALFLLLSFLLFGDALIRQATRFSLFPGLAAARARDQRDFRTTVESLLGFGLVAGVLLGVIVAVMVGVVAKLVGLDEVGGSFVGAWFGLVFLLSSGGATVLAAALEVEERFFLSQARGVFVYLPPLLPLFVLPPSALMWAIPLAMSLGYLMLLVSVRVRVSQVFGFRAHPRWSGAGEVGASLGSAGHVGLGYVLVQLMRLVERSVAAWLVPGGLTQFYLGFRVVSAAQTLSGLSVSTALLPKLNAAVASRDAPQFWRVTRRGLFLTIGGGSGFLMLLLLLRFGLLDILDLSLEFGDLRGDAVLGLAALLAFSLPLFSALPMLNGVLLALGRPRLVMAGMVLFAATQLVTLPLWVHFAGVSGIAASFVIGAWSSGLFMAWALNRFARQPEFAVQ